MIIFAAVISSITLCAVSPPATYHQRPFSRTNYRAVRWLFDFLSSNNGDGRLLIASDELFAVGMMRRAGIKAFGISRGPVPANSISVIANDDAIPFSHFSFEVIWNVYTDVESPWSKASVLREFNRVLQPLGFILIHETNMVAHHLLRQWNYLRLPFEFQGYSVHQKPMASARSNGRIIRMSA